MEANIQRKISTNYQKQKKQRERDSLSEGKVAKPGKHFKRI